MNKFKERLVGVVVTFISSALMFLVFTFFNSFESKASSNTKYQTLLGKIDIILCILDKGHCIKKL